MPSPIPTQVIEAPATETKPYINVVVDCSVYEDYAEGPSFVVIKFDMNTLLEIGQYRRGLEDMQARGLDPHKITSFNHTATFCDPIEADPLNEEEQKSLRFLSKSDKEEWESRFEPFDKDFIPNDEDDEDAPCTSSLWDLESDHSIEADMINITYDSMSITGYIKHTDIRIESNVIYPTDFDEIVKWVEEL